MTNGDAIALMGAPGSPYTRKMLALLRYRRIRYRFLIAGSPQAEAMPSAHVRLLPTFYFPDAAGEFDAVVDSTPIIRTLEDMSLGRSVIPEDPALEFLDYLIEDYAIGTAGYGQQLFGLLTGEPLDADDSELLVAGGIRYDQKGTALIDGIRRISKPGRRVYVGKDEIPRVRHGLGVAVLSTSKGILSDREAREQNVGGEIVCEVW